MKYPYYIEPETLEAKKQTRCQGFACYNKIEIGQIYFNVTTDLANKGTPVKQDLCVKCIQRWFNNKIKHLTSEIVNTKNELGKVEGLEEKYYGGI